MKLKDVLKWLDELAPFDSAEEWDNVGLLAGDGETEVTRVLICLDVTEEVAKRAEETGAQLVLSHHPLLFDPLRRLTETREARLACRLIRNGTAIVAAHTNLDGAKDGVNACLLRALGVEPEEREGFVFAGKLPKEMSAEELLQLVRININENAWFFGSRSGRVSKIAVCSGGGGDFYESALHLGAQAFLTGDMAHHHVVRAKDLGLQVYVAGHAPTENVVLAPLAERIERELGIPAEAWPYKTEEE